MDCVEHLLRSQVLSYNFLFFYEYDSIKKKMSLIHWNLPSVALQETVGGAMVQMYRCLENIPS